METGLPLPIQNSSFGSILLSNSYWTLTQILLQSFSPARFAMWVYESAGCRNLLIFYDELLTWFEMMTPHQDYSKNRLFYTKFSIQAGVVLVLYLTFPLLSDRRATISTKNGAA